jgi:hypothetical protein
MSRTCRGHHPLWVRQGRLPVKLLEGRENDCFVPAQISGLTGAVSRDEVNVCRNLAEPGSSDCRAPHKLYGVCHCSELPDVAAIDEQDDAHSTECHRKVPPEIVAAARATGLPMESAFRHGRLCQ